MSEYQYYEFQAIDRPLTAREMSELRAVSSRVTKRQFRLPPTWRENSPDLVICQAGNTRASWLPCFASFCCWPRIDRAVSDMATTRSRPAPY